MCLVCIEPWPRWPDLWVFTNLNGCLFIFVGDLNDHHQVWLGSTTMNRHGVAALDFATISGCDQLVIDPTHARGWTLNLLMTDVPGLVQITVVAPLGTSNHSSLSIAISMTQAVPNLCVCRKVLLKHRINRTAGCYACNMWAAKHLECWQCCWDIERAFVSAIVKRFPATKVVLCITMISLGLLMINLRQEAYLRWTRDRFWVNMGEVWLSAHFDGKYSMDPVALPCTCHPSPSLTTFAFRSRKVRRLLLDLDSHDGTDPIGYVSCFFLKTADFLGPRIAEVFRRLRRLGSFPVFWRVVNVTPIPKGTSSSSAANYRPIFLTLIPTNKFSVSGIRSYWAVYYMQRCASNNPARLPEWSLHLWCSSVCGTNLTVLCRWGRRLE